MSITPKERLRHILCTREDIKDAVKVLENLIRLDKEEKSTNWHRVKIETEHEKDIFSKLAEGGLIDGGNITYSSSYYLYTILPRGEKLYAQLTHMNP